ncbi:MAG: hypothetical protein ACREA7_03790 [Nitrosotalea sp.]
MLNNNRQQIIENEVRKHSPAESPVGRMPVKEGTNLPNKISGIQNKVKDPATCPHCGISSSGLVSIQSIFGMRNMDNGTLRVQSWCRECRKFSAKTSEVVL